MKGQNPVAQDIAQKAEQGVVEPGIAVAERGAPAIGEAGDGEAHDEDDDGTQNRAEDRGEEMYRQHIAKRLAVDQRSIEQFINHASNCSILRASFRSSSVSPPASWVERVTSTVL